MEVFPKRFTKDSFVKGLLHVRGGVSGGTISRTTYAKSSPRPWRCFPGRPRKALRSPVFSTSVEVFLNFCPLLTAIRRLLHVRGGVSGSVKVEIELVGSSPRPWRCFRCKWRSRRIGVVFSTSVEVFLLRVVIRIWKWCLLHVRGGVSA